jgi:hypothetical protein
MTVVGDRRSPGLTRSRSAAWRKNMPEPTKFQQMNGCAACKHSEPSDSGGSRAAAQGKAYWCARLQKAVDARDGSVCPDWET